MDAQLAEVSNKNAIILYFENDKVHKQRNDNIYDIAQSYQKTLSHVFVFE